MILLTGPRLDLGISDIRAAEMVPAYPDASSHVKQV